jgi:hypothetical protein
MKFRLFASLVALIAVNSACSANSVSKGEETGSGAGPGSGGGTVVDLGGSGGTTMIAIGGGGGAAPVVDNPKTCDEAAAVRSYVGCEFWPTVTANPVWNDFDPAVVVANAGDSDAVVTVTGPAGFTAEATIPAGSLSTIVLKWVVGSDGINGGLKGPLWTANTSGGRLNSSIRVDDGAYHLTSTIPVTAWQFNPLQYVKGDKLSASNDASLLLPTAAMTGNYRIFGYSSKHEGTDWGSVPGGAAITATTDGTVVTVQLGPKCGAEIWPTTDLGACVAAGDGITEGMPSDVVEYTMDAGDVVQLVAAWAKDPQTKHADLSGTVVNATQPVQVVAFNAIAQLPDATVANADHMEETMLPAEVIGKKYVVAPPTTPNGDAQGHVIRIYGNVNDTHLTYIGEKPPGAPDVIHAGDMVQIPPLPTGQPAEGCTTAAGHCMWNKPFIVEADQSFAVMSFMVGGTLQMPGTDPMTSSGDPAFSQMVTPEQFRKEYKFLAPLDYTQNFADILVPDGAEVTLDGAALTTTPERIADSEWSLYREPLGVAAGGVHALVTTDERGLGLQVAGFGKATSYYYPGGLNLKLISEPPVIVVK